MLYKYVLLIWGKRYSPGCASKFRRSNFLDLTTNIYQYILSEAMPKDQDLHRHLTHLREADIGGVYAKALAAHVESVLADQAVLVGADATVAPTLSELLWVRVDQSLGTHIWYLQGGWGVEMKRAAIAPYG